MRLTKRKSLLAGIFLLVAVSGFLIYWFDPNRVVWTDTGVVMTANQSGSSWHVLVFLAGKHDLYNVYDGQILALNGLGTLGSSNYCWGDGSGCVSPQSFSVNETLTVRALNGGSYEVYPR